jgi:hypothetical protein
LSASTARTRTTISSADDGRHARWEAWPYHLAIVQRSNSLLIGRWAALPPSSLPTTGSDDLANFRVDRQLAPPSGRTHIGRYRDMRHGGGRNNFFTSRGDNRLGSPASSPTRRTRISRMSDSQSSGDRSAALHTDRDLERSGDLQADERRVVWTSSGIATGWGDGARRWATMTATKEADLTVLLNRAARFILRSSNGGRVTSWGQSGGIPLVGVSW